MAQPDRLLKKDLADGMSWQHRQCYENDRKRRIFDGKEHTLDLNTSKLQLQVADKNLQRAKHENLQMHYNQQNKDMERAMHAQDRIQERLDTYDRVHQRHQHCRVLTNEYRREWELSDPQRYRHSLDYSIQGPSSAQVYRGNDANYGTRKLQQRDQLRSWLDQQCVERRHAEEERKKADETYHQLMLERDKNQANMAAMQEHARKLNIAEMHSFNEEMARKKRLKRELEQVRMREVDKAEIQNTLNGPLLCQKQGVAELKSNRNAAYVKRGMTEQEMARFREDQKSQVDSVCTRKREESMMHKQWEQYFDSINRQLCLEQLHHERQSQQNRDNRMMFNKKMIGESRDRRRNMYNDQEPCDMKPFYNWFNRNSR